MVLKDLKTFQVTDVLVSPKYEEGETTDEEEDSDDTVYECPGLAATNGSEMVVRNPFFMQGELQPSPAAAPVMSASKKPLLGDANGGMLPPPPGSKAPANKKPISQYTDLFHHQQIAGFN